MVSQLKDMEFPERIIGLVGEIYRPGFHPGISSLGIPRGMS